MIVQALFWDFGSLPQKPRTPDEERTFKQALKIMADVYASPLGTMVLQIKQIPPRPAELNGRVLACELASAVNDADLRSALGAFGPIEECSRRLDSEVAHVKFASHEHASAAAAHGSSWPRLGERAFVCMQYNERPYAHRGWCVAEEVFSTECLLRVPLPPMSRPKIVSLGDQGEADEIVPKMRRMSDVKQEIGSATFTGKGDHEVVLHIFLTFQYRLDQAAL